MQYQRRRIDELKNPRDECYCLIAIIVCIIIFVSIVLGAIIAIEHYGPRSNETLITRFYRSEANKEHKLKRLKESIEKWTGNIPVIDIPRPPKKPQKQNLLLDGILQATTTIDNKNINDRNVWNTPVKIARP